MAKIRRIGIFDLFKVQKMVSFLETNDVPSFGEQFLLLPLTLLQAMLPLKLRFFKETFISVENKLLNGMISVCAERGNHYKWNIKHLFVEQNSHLAGRQLIDFVLSKFGALGANTFCVVVDDNNEEIIDIFSKGCGFRLCSHETLWKMNTIVFSEPKSDNDNFRSFKNSDSKEICELYNDNIFPHFRYSLARSKAEFYESVFQGLDKFSAFKYVLEDSETGNIKGFIEISTSDNYNYILDIIVPQYYEDRYQDCVQFAINQIMKRKKDFQIFVLEQKYLMSAKSNEQYLKEHNFEIVRNQMVLIKDFFKTIKNEDKFLKPAISFSEIKGKPAFNIAREDKL